MVWLFLWPIPLALLALSRPAGQRRAWWALAAVGALAWAGIAASDSTRDDSDHVEVSLEPSASDEHPSSSRPTTSTTERQARTALAARAPEGGHRSGTLEKPEAAEPDAVVRTPESNALLGLLATLPVEGERSRDGYDRDLFPQWDDEDGDGCDTRCEVLAAQALSDGAWQSPWDGSSTSDPLELHIDHVVALAEAWDSGAASWSPARRDQFADDPANLLVVSATSNEAKGDGDAAEWSPSNAEANCLWASTVVRVKASWQLSVDEAERGALANLLQSCPDYVAPTTTTTTPPTTTTTARPVVVTAPPTTAAPPPPPPPPPVQSCTPGYSPCIPPGSDVDCFGGSGDGPRYVDGPVSVDPGSSDPYDLDRDGNGIGCQS